MASDDFDVELFETRLEGLKDTQDGIQQMSAWCLKQRAHHKKIVASWLNVFKRVRVEHRLVLFYLANDVIQYSKRKRLEFVESWATALQKATTMVRDEKVKNKILRIFSIWEQREIYNEEFLTDLCGLLNIAPPKKSHPTIPDSEDYQNASLITSIRECVELSEMTDKSFKKMPKAPNCDIESIKQHLKDKSHSDDVEKELERYAAYIEAFNKNLQAEIKSRKMVLTNLDTAVKFYANQRGEVKVVVSAYKNFGSRIKLVKKKLDEITPTLASPIPSPDVNAPSPEPDADLQLPDEQSPIPMSFFKNNLNGYSSYLDGNLPFDINDFKSEESASKTSSQPIEVIGSRSDEESFNSSADYYKPESINVYSGNDNVMIPGITPMPVPAVPSGGYTSLARSSQQYNDVLPPPPNPPMFGSSSVLSNNLHHGMNPGYAPMNTRPYNTNESYDQNPYSRVSGPNGGGVGLRRVGNSPMQQPLMPPPPMPSMGAMDNGENGGANSFNSPWDMGMSWSNPLDSSSASTSSYGNTPIDTPLSPPHFDVDSLNASSTTLEYTEHDSSLSSAQDVDHRQLHLPAFGIGSKLGLSKEKTRQLDIDHRNLISLTGSPGANESDKKPWYQGSNETSSDVDYRVLGQTIKTIETTTTILPVFNDTSSVSSADDIGNHSATISPEKNDSPSKDSQKDDSFSQPTADEGGGGTGGYDPTDMVVDMDMSDEDLDDIFREVNEQMAEQSSSTDMAADINSETNGNEASDSATEIQHTRPPLLETPAEYDPQTNWDCPDWSQQMAHMPWPNNRGGGAGQHGVPPPPRPPYAMQFPYGPGAVTGNDNNPFAVPGGSPLPGGRGGFGGGGRGRGGVWEGSPQNQFRNFPRPPRGAIGAGGSPFFNRGRGRGMGSPMIRGGPSPGYRGKFRGKNNWI
ncbi:regulation of nuclear pre-mRNA domain-containing protein 2 [Stomoxys calcitrans]|uniref:regulation of nuclear pre-mRNA domain-containing protein 2 n=1 Tax=Stomoxys calcitrans TaxID=35570 RepID=UPI0027E338E2|nr:regulation of nuclear pre-mRNA domain-containing protein 2 [Stomoxys calcitrans]